MSAARLQEHVPQSGELQREVIEILQQLCRDFPNDLTFVAAALQGGAYEFSPPDGEGGVLVLRLLKYLGADVLFLPAKCKCSAETASFAKFVITNAASSTTASFATAHAREKLSGSRCQAC
eukprot:346353-Prymnesium_polylepis.1